MKRSFLLPVVILALSPTFSAGQSLLGTRGLGLPLEPLDGRARALGSVGTGLFGSSLLPTDPASTALLLLPSIQVTLQPQWGSGDLNGESQSTQGTRFPLLAVSYPVRRLNGTASLSVSGFLDQRWQIQSSGRTELGGVDTPITDTFRSDGGVSSFRLAWGQRVRDNFSLGMSLGAHTGSVTRTFTRTVDSVGAGSVVVPYRKSGEWRYSALTGSLGFRWDPVEILRVGGTLTWSSDLDAEPTGENEEVGSTYDLPAELRLGASGLLTPQLALNVGLSYSNWNTSGVGLEEETVVGSVWSVGGGMEWRGANRGGRNFPFRLGVRRTQLPFAFQGDKPVETVFAGGIGLNLVRAETGLGGGVDVGLERGDRKAGGLNETFWRCTLTIRVASF